METPELRKKPIHLILLVVTIVTTTIAGAEWMFAKSLFFGDETLSFSEVLAGLYFSVPFLSILTVHEFGHYITARINRVQVTLPYYIPLWLGFIGLPSIGTMGAFIRITGAIKSRRQYFDIGVAGPLAGFVVAIMVLFYGFTHLPPADYIFKIHPEYRQYGLDYGQYVYGNNPDEIALGSNLVFMFFEHYVADPARVPNKYEMYHYPWIFAGYLALFFTALNLIPIGQLDGGHAMYGLFGTKYSRYIGRFLFLVMVTISGIGMVDIGQLNLVSLSGLLFYFFLLVMTFHHFEPNMKKRLIWVIWIVIVQIFASKYFPSAGDYGFYLVFSLLIGRFLGVDHPRALEDRPFSPARKVVGWLTLLVFIVSFTPKPMYVEDVKKARDEKPRPIEKQSSPSEVVAGRMVKVF